MLVITKGYLLNKIDYGDFDEIISFINEYGIKFTCFSSGSRKIMSKNARHLNFGCLCEFEFFNSTNKISRLKKVSTITYFEQEYQFNYALHILNDYFNQIDFEDKKYFELYQKVIYYILNDVNEYLIILYICVSLYKLSGIKLVYDKCQKCASTYNLKTIDFKSYGSICKLCMNQSVKNYPINLIKLMFSLENDNLFDLVVIKDFDLIKLRELIHDLMIFIFETLGLYSNYFKVI